jgi:hypothetical protein
VSEVRSSQQGKHRDASYFRSLLTPVLAPNSATTEIR